MRDSLQQCPNCHQRFKPRGLSAHLRYCTHSSSAFGSCYATLEQLMSNPCNGIALVCIIGLLAEYVSSIYRSQAGFAVGFLDAGLDHLMGKWVNTTMKHQWNL